jgi:hypothetical protein
MNFAIFLARPGHCPPRRKPTFVTSARLPGFWKHLFGSKPPPANPVKTVTNVPHPSLEAVLPVICDTWKSARTTFESSIHSPGTSLHQESRIPTELSRRLGMAQMFDFTSSVASVDSVWFWLAGKFRGERRCAGDP